MSNKSVVKTFKQMRRQRRVRKKVQGTPERPRMSVFRSNRNIFVQVIDDLNGRTIVSCSSLDKEIASVSQQGKKKTEISVAVGEQIARKALEKGIKTVVFDRNRYEYHGRVRCVAEGARKAGLEF